MTLTLKGAGGHACAHIISDPFTRSNTAEGEGIGEPWKPNPAPFIHINNNKCELTANIGANIEKNNSHNRHGTPLCFHNHIVTGIAAVNITGETNNTAQWHYLSVRRADANSNDGTYSGILKRATSPAGNQIIIERRRGGIVALYDSGVDNGEFGAQTFSCEDGTGGDAGKVLLNYDANLEVSGEIQDTDPLLYGRFVGIGLRLETGDSSAFEGSLTWDSFTAAEKT